MDTNTSPLLTRFLRYVKIDTQSCDSTGTHPSTEKQLVLAHLLEKELNELGAENVQCTSTGYVYATIPASPGREGESSLGFVSHMDTAPDASGANVKPTLVRYAGGCLPLGDSGRSLDPQIFPFLNQLVGKTFVVTDGTTLLGADDKAGVAIIMTLAARLLASDAPDHGEVRIAFTPDEEIGEGTANFESARFGAKRAYTFDGSEVDVLENANFNAAAAHFAIRGVSVHPGSAKGAMVNAIRLASEIIQSLPKGESPEETEGRQGFYHPVAIQGDVSNATVDLIIRDHDTVQFATKKQMLEIIAHAVNAKYGKGTVSLTVTEQYRNMEEILKRHPGLTDAACDAIRQVGLTPKITAIRGGTDGAFLSEMGIPCPNLGTGGRNFHGEQEFAIVEEMEQALEIGLILACGKKARE